MPSSPARHSFTSGSSKLAPLPAPPSAPATSTPHDSSMTSSCGPSLPNNSGPIAPESASKPSPNCSDKHCSTSGLARASLTLRADSVLTACDATVGTGTGGSAVGFAAAESQAAATTAIMRAIEIRSVDREIWGIATLYKSEYKIIDPTTAPRASAVAV